MLPLRDQNDSGAVRQLLGAAEQMAEGLVELCDHIYDLTDGVVKQPLDAANSLFCQTSEWLREYERAVRRERQ